MLNLVVSLVLLGVGAALLTAGAAGFAENVTAASSRLGVSVLALALLLAGAEPEEAVTAMLASGQGHPALAAGDAIGANLVILTLTLGLAALVTRLPVTRRSLEYGVAAAVLGLVAWLLLLNGVLGRAEGALLVLLYVAGVVWVWRRERTPPLIGEMAELEEKGELTRTGGRTDSAEDPADERATGRALLMVLLGLLGMVVGGFLAVRGAELLVDVFDVGESVVGLTVLALATSAEMVALVWAARRRGLTEVVVAGTVGAVAYNATVTLGLAALVSPLALGRHNVILTVAGATAALPLVLLLGVRSGHLPKWVGALLVVAYVGSVVLLLAR
ncbi:calcium/sodium antiporter [soil metagenome]